MYGCVGSSFLCEGPLQLWQAGATPHRGAGATLHRGARASHYCGLSLPSTGSRRAGSVVVAHGPSCSAACGISPDQGSNPRPPHWQVDSQPLCHQGSPVCFLIPRISEIIQYLSSSVWLISLLPFYKQKEMVDQPHEVICPKLHSK